ncbi:MAG: hypothetical protein HY060_19050, partial [Proteobacteria bacterium]|nr:hypothetical protein [Pseudomonadota bacterium]
MSLWTRIMRSAAGLAASGSLGWSAAALGELSGERTTAGDEPADGDEDATRSIGF